MSIEDRIEATAQNIEGKIQEAVGDLTGNLQDQAEGKEKQVAASLKQTKENIKDELKKRID